MKVVFVISAIAILVTQETVFAEAVFQCYPTHIITINTESIDKKMFSEKESIRNRTVITAKDNKYFWTSNNNHKLYKTRKDGYSIYVNPKGAGHIKIQETLSMPYIENRTEDLNTIIMYGNCK